jgi:glutamate synthase domain-containing protein 2
VETSTTSTRRRPRFARRLLTGAVGAVGGLAAYDLLQHRHAVLRNFPVVGHLRYLLESIGPELRQYIVTDNDAERPFTRDQRRWIYASSKDENTYFGFGTDNDLERTSGYVIVKPSAFPHRADDADHADRGAPLPAAKVLGAARGRRHPHRPASVVNISAMSFGALSGAAVEAMNRGAALAGCLQNTGEGGIAPHHRLGGDLIWQIGTGYYGCRDAEGRFDLARLVDGAASAPVRAIEIKLSQGAKPGLGGMLPRAKVTPEIAAIRGVPVGQDCISPPYHSAFSDVDSLLDFVESIGEATGLPVGIKSAVGQSSFWTDLADRMAATGRGVDFVTVDGGEGGTGAAPLVFSDHVALPFKLGFARVYRAFAERDLADGVVFGGAGKLGLPEGAFLAMALGCDLIGVAREAMLAIGCIQAQRCHTGRCPAGVATQNRWLAGGLDPDLKSVRVAGYLTSLRHELQRLARTCGAAHPALVPLHQLEIVEHRFAATPASQVFGYQPGWGLPAETDREALVELIESS